MRTPKTLAAAATAALLAIPTAAMAATGDGALVTVVHGVPGATVDVYANGDILLEDFEPGTVTDPVELPAGDYELAVYAADADPSTDDPIIGPITQPVSDGLNASVVAHLTEDGDPTATVFVNDTSEVAAGEARLTVRHTAAAGAVDILADGGAIFEDVTNPNEGVIDVAAASYDVAVNAAGTDTEVTAVSDFALAEGANTIVYAIGDPAADPATFELLVQSISGLHSGPDGVPSGEAGLATDTTLPALTLAALLLVAGAAVGLRRRATETV